MSYVATSEEVDNINMLIWTQYDALDISKQETTVDNNSVGMLEERPKEADITMYGSDITTYGSYIPTCTQYDASNPFTQESDSMIDGSEESEESEKDG